MLVCVHGYPDNASFWEPVAELLADDFQVVAYDVRGAGDSDHPASTAAYALDRLLEDFRAVIDQVSPDRPVHVLAHDRGSIQAWHFVTAPNLTVKVIRGGHWMPRNDPGLVARLVLEHTNQVAGWGT